MSFEERCRTAEKSGEILQRHLCQGDHDHPPRRNRREGEVDTAARAQKIQQRCGMRDSESPCRGAAPRRSSGRCYGAGGKVDENGPLDRVEDSKRPSAP